MMRGRVNTKEEKTMKQKRPGSAWVKRQKALGPFMAILGSWAVLASCGTLADAASLAAQAAGDAGIISREMAQAIVKSGEAVNKAAEEISPEQAYYIGRAVGANILSRYKLDQGNPGLIQYLNKIAGALAVNSPLRKELDFTPKLEPYNGYHVGILDSLEINAFATSGGHIFITKGFLACAGSEDALAAILAHEIAHIQLQHSIKAIKTSRITNALLVTGSSVTGALVHDTSLEELTDIFNESVGEIVTTMVNNGYSQTQEFNADALALTLLASAGYEPSSLIDMLQVLERMQPERPGGFNHTHPAPAERISNLQSKIGPLQVEDTRSYRKPRFDALM
jgi:predicted Zn-dependent protease